MKLAVWIALALAVAPLLRGQANTRLPFPQPQPAQTPAPQPPPQPVPVQPAPARQGTPNATAPAQAVQPPAAAPAAPLADTGAFMVPNASLTEMIDILARRLKINYILDPRVKGTVTIYTYGEVRPVDVMQLLQTILRINGATMVQVGDLYRIVPINSISQLPIEPQVNADPKTLPDDDRMILNLIFLQFTTAAEMEKLITPFLGEGASHSVYDAANLLILEDNARSMRRTMDLINLFDSDTFASQRVRLFEINNSRPSDLVKELDSVFRAYALSDKNAAVRFIPVDRINTIIAVSPNPSVFKQVEDWIKKLDIEQKITAGTTNNYSYRLKYGRAETIAAAIMALYTGDVQTLISLAQQANQGMIAAGMGYGTMMANPGYGGMGYGAGNPGGYGGGYGGASPYNRPYAGYGGGGGAPLYGATAPGGILPGAPGTAPGTTPGSANLTGSYLGNATAGAAAAYTGPRVVPNPFDNTLLIQASPQEYEQIVGLIRQLDVAPRQVLIDAKIYEVDLTGEWNAGVESYLQSRNTPGPNGLTRTLTAAGGAAGLTLTTGALVLKSHQLLAALSAEESTGRTRVIAAPSIIATDSIPATMNVGDQVPVVTSTAVVGGVQQNGTNPFASTVSTQSSGTTLSIVAHVNTSGVVTMVINQQVSAPEPAPPNASQQSTSFSNRSIATQMTVQDGDTVAIGGIIQEKRTETSSGVPILHRIPVVGAAFGSKSSSVSRTELIIFLTPRVIYDTTQLVDATEELKNSLKRIQKVMRNEGE